MLDQRGPNAILERECLALRWHKKVLLGERRLTTTNQPLANTSARSCQRHLSTLGQQCCQQNTNVGSTHTCCLGMYRRNQIYFTFFKALAHLT